MQVGWDCGWLETKAGEPGKGPTLPCNVLYHCIGPGSWEALYLREWDQVSRSQGWCWPLVVGYAGSSFPQQLHEGMKSFKPVSTYYCLVRNLLSYEDDTIKGDREGKIIICGWTRASSPGNLVASATHSWDGSTP